MEITVTCGYAAGIGSLVWALTKGESDRKGAFDWSRWRKHLTWPSTWR